MRRLGAKGPLRKRRPFLLEFVESEGVDLTRRRGDAEADAEKHKNKVEAEQDSRVGAGCAEGAESAEENYRK
jgi:hypothetical protein